ncbi:hypothetical protein [Nostoc sp.]|uniref:hypothetical protein n=1 Tax=Nostoc sp. TaxID=1180 RepID=UPI002FFAD38A
MMTNDEQQIKQQQSQIESQQIASDATDSHPIVTSLGAVGGGVAGAALGRSIAGKLGAAIGGVAGAIAGGVAGNQLVAYTEEFIEELQPITGLRLGADHKPIELPTHYTWEELQALSKSQGGEIQVT